MKPETAQPPESAPAPQTAPKPQPQAVKASEIVSLEMPPVTGGVSATAPEQPPGSAPKLETPHELAGQVDSLNRPFDPEKFRPEKDILGRWKNLRGGRKPKTAAAPVSETASYIPPEPPPPAPETGNGAETENGPVGETAPKPNAAMPAASSKSVAEVATNGVYTLTGALIRNPKAARPSPAEHANLRDTAAAYLEARGVRFVGGAAIGIGLLAYCIGDDERRGAIWARLKAAVSGIASLFRKRPVIDVTPPRPVTAQETPAPAKSQPAAAGQPDGTVSAFGN